MRYRLAGALVLGAILSIGALDAQTYKTPRTPWGHPDLQGYWTNTTTTPLQRPAELKDKAVLSGAELAERDKLVADRANQDAKPRPGNPGTYNDFWYERGALNPRTALVIDPPDGRVPALTDAAQKRAAADRQGRGPADSPEDRSAFERCITRGLPGAMLPGFYNHNYQIVQTRDYVVINVEMIHDARIIPLAPAARRRPRSGTGWAIRAAAGKATRWSSRRPTSTTRCASSRSSRFRRGRISGWSSGSGGPALPASTTSSPSTIRRSTRERWTASVPMVRIDGPIFEYACHEGNYGMGGILRGARAEEQAVEGAANRR